MKTLIIIRHSEPIKDRTIKTEMLPLSDKGHIKAQNFFSLDIFRFVKAVYTSPYKRAFSTAEKLNGHPIADKRLRERDLGDPTTLNEGFWMRQYNDYGYKNKNGESLNDVRARMTSVIDEILSEMCDEDTVAVISHAAAICAFLLNWCSVEVTDNQNKLRKIKYIRSVVLNGKIATPSAFVLEFENNLPRTIKYIDIEKEE